jgi:thioredoxin 1
MNVTDDNFNGIINTHKLIMIDFWAEWCRPCKIFGPVIEEVSRETGIWLGKMNIDTNIHVPKQYEVASIPTTILFKDGVVVKRIIGAKPKHVMIKELEEWV